jgi:hypothetical protein
MSLNACRMVVMSVGKECVLCFLYYDGCSLNWDGFICTCATCFDLQGDALVSMYRSRGGVSVECGACPRSSSCPQGR